MARLSSLIALVFAGLSGAAIAAPAPIRSGETFTMTKASDGVYKVSPISAGGTPVSQSITSGSVMMGAGAVSVLDTFSATGPTGAAMAMQVARGVDWDHVLEAGALGLMATKSPWGAGAVAAYDIWKQLRTKPDGQGGAVRDLGAPPSPQINTEYQAQYTGATWVSTPDQAGSGWRTYLITEQSSTSVASGCSKSYDSPSYSGLQVTVLRRVTCTPQSGYPALSTTDYTVGILTRSTEVLTCPAGGSPGLDGKCETGSYAPVSINDLKQLLNDQKVVAAAQAQAVNLINDGLSTGQSVTPQSQTLSGPSSQQGAPVTTTTTDSLGNQVTKVLTDTYNFTYSNGDTVNYTKTNVATTTNNTTNQTTTETTTNAATATGDLCKDHPDVLACVKLGEAQVDPPTPQQVPFSINSVGMPDASGCPAPLPFTVAGHTYAITWDPVCNAASTYARPVMLVCAVALAAFVFIGGLKA